MRLPLHFICSIGNLPFKLVTAAENRLSDEVRSVQHQHFGHEFHYLFDGSCSLLCDGQTYHMHEGDIMLIPSSAYHRFFNHSPNIRKLNVEFEAPKNKTYTHPTDASICDMLARSDIQIIHDIPTSNKLLYDGLSLLSDTLHTKKDTYVFHELLRAQIAFVLTCLFSELTETRHSPNILPNIDASKYDRIDMFFNYEYQSNSFEKLAQELSLSHRQLGRIVQQSYGMSLRGKRNEIRVKIAMDLLQNTQNSIENIAEILGYSSPSSFCSFFKKQTGMTPTAFRRKIVNED